MLNGKKILAIIPARGGSKGVARKNIRLLAGKELIAWTIIEAQKSQYIDKLILSSEDAEIIKAAQKFGCEAPFIRPQELAEDDTPGILPVLHAIGQVPGFDYVVLLQPTSPLKLAQDIDGCLRQCVLNKSFACVTVAESQKHPNWMFYLDSGTNKMRSFAANAEIASRRQNLSSVYALNGAVYVAKTEELLQAKSFLTKETTAYVMPLERSLDIDSEMDFKIAEVFIKERSVV